MSRSQFSLLAQRRFGPYFATQVLGAFNHHVFKSALVIWVTFTLARLTDSESSRLVNLAAGLFILPFFLFSSTAGQLAEKYEKSALIRNIKLIEIGIMALAALGLYLGQLTLLCGVLFLMGTQAALFGPVKYSILPQHLGEPELVGGNALVEAASFLSLVLGTLLGGWLIAQDGSTTTVGAVVLVIALSGYLTARQIPRAAPAAPNLVINWNPFTETARNLRFLSSNRTVFLSALGVSWFGFFAAAVWFQLPAYTRQVLFGDETVVILVLALLSLGIGLGCLACERMSGRKVEIGLVPFGSIGLTLVGVDLYFAPPDFVTQQVRGAFEVLFDPGYFRVWLDLMLLGVFGGFYIVPLHALIQARCEPSHRSRVIAGTQILNALMMVLSSLLAFALLEAGVRVRELLLVIVLMNAAVAGFIYTRVPEFLMRFLAWLLMSLLYRIRHRGLEQVPETGPAILTANHVSYVDALIILACVRRPIRFVMYHRIFDIPVLSFIFRTGKAIPIAPAKEDPQRLAAAYVEIDRALAQGELIGLFPEGVLTPDGEIQPLKPGIERILAARPVPVVPMVLKGLWESMWSKRNLRLSRTRLPRRFRARVELEVGAPLAPQGLDIQTLEAHMRRLHGPNP